MVLGESLDHRLESQQTGGGEHPRLAHAATQPLALQARLGDHVVGAGQERAHRGAESLGQAAHHGRGRIRPDRGRDPGGRLGVEEAGAVEVDGHVTCRRHHRAESLQRPRGATCRHVGVLDADERDRGLVVGGCLSGPAHVVGVEHAVAVVDGMELHGGIAGGRTVLVGHHVLAPAGHHGGARPGQDPEGDLIGHGARRHEERGGLPQACRERLLQGPDRRVLPVVVVTHVGLGHGPAHGGRRAGDRVTAKVDDIHHAATLTMRPVTSGGARAPSRWLRRPRALPEREARHPRAARRRGRRSRARTGGAPPPGDLEGPPALRHPSRGRVGVAGRVGRQLRRLARRGPRSPGCGHRVERQPSALRARRPPSCHGDPAYGWGVPCRSGQLP